MFLLQDLRRTLQKTRAELQTKEAALKESEAERLAVLQEKEGNIAQLTHTVQDKERQLQVTHTHRYILAHTYRKRSTHMQRFLV